MKKLKLVANILLLLLIAAIIQPLSTPVQAQGAEPGPATDIIQFKAVDVNLVAQAIRSGEIDYYIFGLTPTQAEAMFDAEDIELYFSPASTVAIGVNPAPAPEGQLNPFSIREIRFALNYLADRDFMISQVYSGFAAPMQTFISSYTPDFVTIYDIVAKYDFKYDPVTAQAIIDKEMTDAGATKVDGKWQYNGEPVVIKFIIRIEDERREIGDTFANLVEDAGFTIDRIYMDFGQAIPTVYYTDPADLEWQLYTEGWGASGSDKYDSVAIHQYGAPWFGWLPGLQEPTYWNYENDTIDVISKKIYYGNFTDRAERDALYSQATEMIIQEAVKIWLVNKLDIQPAGTHVRGLTEDVGTGTRSPYCGREAYVPGRNETLPVIIGHLHVHSDTSIWNPIGGHEDVYSNDIARLVQDPYTYNDPFNGLPIPKRWGYEVMTVGPTGSMEAPSDAFIWNVTTDSWEAVGSGVMVKSKVTFDLSNYIGSKWHHGENITWADILYSTASLWELAFDPVRSALESGQSSQKLGELEPIKAFKIVDETIEVYLDYWHFSEDYIASFADWIGLDPATGHYPWELLAAMDIVVFTEKTLMGSGEAAQARGVPHMSVNLPAHAAIVQDAMNTKLLYSNVSSMFNVLGTIYATAGDLSDRKAASNDWINTYGHAVICDGPYYLEIFDAAANFAQLRAVRDPSYPFSAGQWYYGRPEAPEITEIAVPTVVPGGASSFVIELSGVPPLGVKYLIRDPLTAEILDIGDATAITSSKFRISLSSEFTDAMEPGLYELSVAGYSDAVAFINTAKEYFDVFNVNPLESSFQDVGTAISSQLTTTTNTLNDAVASVASATNNLMIVMIVVAVLIVVNIVLVLIKKP
jgi:peptide/nickel transport system substrate-binding protein